MRTAGALTFILIAGLGLAGCTPYPTGTVCTEDEGIRLGLPSRGDCINAIGHIEDTCGDYAAVTMPVLEALAAETWVGSRDANGHSRWRCWYDQEPDLIATTVRVSLALGVRSVTDWLAVADSSRHDAVRATVLLTVAKHDDAAAIERLLAYFSRDGRGLHESMVRHLSFVDTPLGMQTVLTAIDVIGYPEDRLWGAPYSHDPDGWFRALAWQYASRAVPSYWLLGIGAPSGSSLLGRARELHGLEIDLREAQSAAQLAARASRAAQ